MMKDSIMSDIDFQLNEAFSQLTQGREITRNDLLEALNGICDQPHVDILYAKLSASTVTKTITKSDFIECITPIRAKAYY